MSETISRRGFLYGALASTAVLAVPSFFAAGEERKKMMKVTVCELNNDEGHFSEEWEKLVVHVKNEKSDLVLLPELIFAPWVAFEPEYKAVVWEQGEKAHEEWKKRLKELSPAIVLGSGPVTIGGKRLNEAFVWESASGYKPVHYKYYVPNLRGFWEANWYQRGEKEFAPVQTSKALLGFMICTELWFFQHSREYGQKGIHIVVNPRATARNSGDKWLVGGRATSIVSGAYSLSSIRVTTGDKGPTMGGTAWIIAPSGEVMGQTSKEQPFLTMEIDLEQAERAKKSYPRDVVG